MKEQGKCPTFVTLSTAFSFVTCRHQLGRILKAASASPEPKDKLTIAMIPVTSTRNFMVFLLPHGPLNPVRQLRKRGRDNDGNSRCRQKAKPDPLHESPRCL